LVGREFEGNARNLNTKAKALQEIAKTGNAQQANTAAADLGRTTCGACHDAFRGPETKK